MNELWAPILITALATIAVAVAGAWATDLGPWYYALKQPSFKPPDWAFGPAWTLIFAFTAAAAVIAWRDAPDTSARHAVITVFVLNGLLNILWSVIYFRMKRPDWAFAEVIFLWLCIALIIYVVWEFSHLAAWLMLPYLLWVIFAAALNYATIKLNGPFTATAN